MMGLTCHPSGNKAASCSLGVLMYRTYASECHLPSICITESSIPASVIRSGCCSYAEAVIALLSPANIASVQAVRRYWTSSARVRS